MDGLKGILTIMRELNSKFFTSEDIESGKFAVTFKGFTTY